MRGNDSLNGWKLLQDFIPEHVCYSKDEYQNQWERTAGISYFLNQKTSPWCSLKPVCSIHYHTKSSMFLLGFSVQPHDASQSWKEALNHQDLIRMNRDMTQCYGPAQEVLEFKSA